MTELKVSECVTCENNCARVSVCGGGGGGGGGRAGAVESTCDWVKSVCVSLLPEEYGVQGGGVVVESDVLEEGVAHHHS